MTPDTTLDLEPAVEAAARAHYAYVWATVNGNPEASLKVWDSGGVKPATMDYHRAHVRHQVEACAPILAHQGWKKADAWLRYTDGINLDLSPWELMDA